MTVPSWVRDNVREQAGEETEIRNVQVLKDGTLGKLAAVETDAGGLIIEQKTFGRSQTFTLDFLGPDTSGGLEVTTEPVASEPVVENPVADALGLTDEQAQTLDAHKIDSLATFARADAGTLADELGTTEDEVETWQATATLSTLGGVTVDDASVLVNAGVHTIDGLAALTANELIDQVGNDTTSREVLGLSGAARLEWAAACIEAARRHVGVPVDEEPTVEATPSTTALSPGGPLTEIEGIGETREAQLFDLGIETPEDLHGANTDKVAEALDVSPKVVARWQSAIELTTLTGIGPQYGELLARTGVTSIENLANTDPQELLDAVNEKEASLEVNIQGNTIGPKRVAGWINTAREAIGLDGAVEVPTLSTDTTTVEEVVDDLTEINGIGQVRAEALSEHGITSFQGLLTADPVTVAEGLNVGEDRVVGWQTTVLSQNGDLTDLTELDGIGDRRALSLFHHGITSQSDLANANPETVANGLSVSQEQVVAWQEAVSSDGGR